MTSSRTDPTTKRPPGRRPGASGTREAILAAAREAFAARGLERTTIRAVAAAAGVDAALVLHYFESKQGLFRAAMRPPFDPRTALPPLFAGGREAAGEPVARFIVGVLERDESRERMLGIVRAAASDDEAAEMLRATIADEVLGTIARALDLPDAPLRASLMGVQVVGLAMARYVVRVEPLASAPPDEVVAWLAPLLQHCMTGAPAASAAHRGGAR
jgi:AcrR family transcriptional regulator